MAAIAAAAAGGSGRRVRTNTRGLCRRRFAAATVLSGAGVGVASSPPALLPALRDSLALTVTNPRSVRWPPRSTVTFVTLFQPHSSRLILERGCVLTVDQAGISCFFPFLPVVPRRRLVSPHSPRITPRAAESSRSRRRSTVRSATALAGTGQIYLFYSSDFGGSSAAPFTRFFLFMVRGSAACAALFYVFAYLLGSWGICQPLWENTPKKWNSQANSAARHNDITSAPRALNSPCRCRCNRPTWPSRSSSNDE